MGEYKTPGVYIKEKNAFGTSVVEVETAVPAFIGYTEKALNGTEDLTGKPFKITSMAEYIQYFGGMSNPEYTIDIIDQNANQDAPEKKNNGKRNDNKEDQDPNSDQKAVSNSFSVKYDDLSLSVTVKKNFTLYLNMMLFFANGGGPCYIVSVGNYKSEFSEKKLEDAIKSLESESEPTMVVIPEATNLASNECITLQQQMAEHCGDKAKNRIAILDVFIDRYPESPTTKVDYAGNYINSFSTGFPSYVATYYPYLRTSILSLNDVTYEMINISKLDVFLDKLGFKEEDFKEPKEDPKSDESKESQEKPKNDEELKFNMKIHQALLQNSKKYALLVKAILDDINLLPPSAAMAGVYTTVDNTRGVWKAPANVTINSVIKPSININDDDQQELNSPMSGKAINAIRTFPGDGLKVWGARTYDGNSLDWRYINVRRTMMYLEQSVKNAARAYVFEPNDASTWINMKCMIENFLRSVWKRGGLAGSTPEEAFEVHVGLGDTMTGDDILEGMLRITVLVAVTHPAEFIEITFQQQMQKS